MGTMVKRYAEPGTVCSYVLKVSAAGCAHRKTLFNAQQKRKNVFFTLYMFKENSR